MTLLTTLKAMRSLHHRNNGLGGFGDSNPTGKAKLVEFLGRLPKLPAHYCRRDSSKIYIEPILGNRMSDVYAEYKRQCEDSIVPIKPLSTFTFYKVIESENLAFQ